MADRQLRLGAFMRPVGIHTGWWRYPGAYPDANFNFEHLKRFARTLERGKFDAFFMADHLAVLNMPIKALRRSATVTSFEPLTLLSALAGATERIGLIATASTTFDEPYHIARRFASLDHISGGRAGWNIVTTSNPDAALNFGLEDHLDHDERYRRAREFYDVVTGLWDSFAEDAFVRDVESGIYFNPDRMHTLDHKGQFLKVRGPLNIARPIQGWPVIVQAGASDAGRQLAAETAEVIFAAGGPLADGKRFYADVKSRMKAFGRPPEHLKVLPGALVIVGDTDRRSEAEEGAARQPRSSRQRPRLVVDCARLRRFGLRPRRSAAGDPGIERQQERARALRRARQARQSHRAAACSDRWKLRRSRLRRHAGDDRRCDGAMAV